MAKQWEDRTEADIAAWWSPEDKAPIMGELLGMRVLKDSSGKPRAVWVIETKQSTMARLKGEETGKEFPAGTVIGVGHRSKLNPIVEQFSQLEGFDVAVNPGEKIRISGGRTMWKFQVKTRGGHARPVALNAASMIPRQLTAGNAPSVTAPVQGGDEGEEGGDDDIPF